MIVYQLACACWQQERDRYEIGGVLACLDHGRQIVIGIATPARFLTERTTP